MNLQLQVVFFTVSFITLVWVIREIRKHKMNIDDSIIWIIWALFLLVLSIYPNLAIFISRKMGFISASNFILSLFIFFLYIILFFQTISMSGLKEKNKELIQKLSIKEYESKQKDQEGEDD